MRFTFTQKERLKSKRFLELMFKQGKGLYAYPFRVVYLHRSADIKLVPAVDFVPQFPVQFGVGASSKHLKKAVDRNRIKRLTREAWRTHKHILYEHCNSINKQYGIFFTYTQKEVLTHVDIEKAVQNAIKKLKNELQ